MTVNITISVPDDLHREMQEWKDSFNYSKFFQNAIRKAIQQKKEFSKRLKGEGESMNEIIERLKKEKTKDIDLYFEYGKKEGVKWAKAASYHSLKLVVGTEGNEFPFDTLENFGAGDRDWLEEVLKKDPVIEEPEIYEVFERGLMEGVRAFWAEVEGNL